MLLLNQEEEENAPGIVAQFIVGDGFTELDIHIVPIVDNIAETSWIQVWPYNVINRELICLLCVYF